MLGEEACNLLLRLAAEVQRVAAGGTAADAQNAVLHQLARLREEAVVREQEEEVGGAAGGSRPGANAGDHACGVQAVRKPAEAVEEPPPGGTTSCQQVTRRCG
jgi:hypothetical protein